MNIRAKIDKVLSKHSEECTYNMQLTHDGVDRDCYPKSYIYDLLVWEEDTILNYHYENWFHPGDEEAEFGLIWSDNADTFFDSNHFCVKSTDFVKK